MNKIEQQIEELLTGERRSLSVHEQWQIAQSMRAMHEVVKAAHRVWQEYRCGDPGPSFDRKVLAMNDALANYKKITDEGYTADDESGERQSDE